MYELLALKFWKFPGRQCLMDSFFLLFNISGQIAYRKKSEISDFTFILDMLGLARTESDWVGYWKKSGIDGIVGDWRLVNMKRNILFMDLLSFCSCFNGFSQMCVFLSCHRCPRWLRRVWDMSGIPFTRSLAVRHRNSVTLWRPLRTCSVDVCLFEITNML